MDTGNAHISADWHPNVPANDESSVTIDEFTAAIDQLDVADNCHQKVLEIFQQKCDSENTETKILEFLRRLGEMYIHDTTGFEVMFFQLLAGGNQAALARLRGCSKQNINKIVAKGKKRLEAYRETVQTHPECRLTYRELAAFHAVELQGMTYREAGKYIGCSHTEIKRMFPKMRLKGLKCSKKYTGRRVTIKKVTLKSTDVLL